MSDVPLGAVLAAHTVRGAAATSLLHARRSLASAECKPGKAPKNVDYVGESLWTDSAQVYLQMCCRPLRLHFRQVLHMRVHRKPTSVSQLPHILWPSSAMICLKRLCLPE